MIATMRRLVKEQEGLYSLLWFTLFFVFVFIPLLILLMYVGQMFYIKKSLQSFEDQAIVGAITDVTTVQYTSSQGDDLWYYKINTTGGTTQANGTIVLDSSASPVWQYANQVISANLNNSAGIVLAQPLKIVVSKKSFSQNITVYSGGTSSSYKTTNTDYITAQMTANFSAPDLFPINVFQRLYGATQSVPSTITVTWIPSATVGEPNISVNR